MATGKKRVKKNIPVGQVHVQSTFNNTIVTFTDRSGNAISWSSAGKMGFKGARKSTPFAAQEAARDAAERAKLAGISAVEVFVEGPGQGKDAAIKAVAEANIRITMLKDVTAVPHNGCRPPKRRRV